MQLKKFIKGEESEQKNSFYNVLHPRRTEPNNHHSLISLSKLGAPTLLDGLVVNLAALHIPRGPGLVAELGPKLAHRALVVPVMTPRRRKVDVERIAAGVATADLTARDHGAGRGFREPDQPPCRVELLVVVEHVQDVTCLDHVHLAAYGVEIGIGIVIVVVGVAVVVKYIRAEHGHSTSTSISTSTTIIARPSLAAVTVTKQFVPDVNQAGLEIEAEELRRVDAVLGDEEAEFLPEAAADIEKGDVGVGLEAREKSWSVGDFGPSVTQEADRAYTRVRGDGVALFPLLTNDYLRLAHAKVWEEGMEGKEDR